VSQDLIDLAFQLSIAEQWDSMVTKHQWSKLERLFDAEAQKRGYPQCSKTGSAIGAKLKNMDMDEAIELAFMGADVSINRLI
jgi:hypothetical protein